MFEDRFNRNYLIDDLIMELELLKENWEHLDGKKIRVRIEKKIKTLRTYIRKAGHAKSSNPNLELSTIFRGATPGNTSQSHDASENSSTSQPVDGKISEDTQIDAIAIVEFLEKDSCVQLDTSIQHFLLLNAATAMRHVDTFPQGRYTAGLDEWGRVILQAEENSHLQC